MIEKLKNHNKASPSLLSSFLFILLCFMIKQAKQKLFYLMLHIFNKKA